MEGSGSARFLELRRNAVLVMPSREMYLEIARDLVVEPRSDLRSEVMSSSDASTHASSLRTGFKFWISGFSVFPSHE